MSISQKNHSIKHRTTANDVFITPVELCKIQIEMIEYKEEDKWLDPFKNTGNYYNNYPTTNKDWTEILENKDFFEYKEPCDIICSNPPYSCIDKVLEHSVKLQPRIISYLLLEGKMTPKRMEFMNTHGYSLSSMYMCKVFSWYGMAVAYTFTKSEEPDNICYVEYDRIVHR